MSKKNLDEKCLAQWSKNGVIIDEVLEEWKSKMYWGISTEIKDTLGVSMPTVLRAINKGIVKNERFLKDLLAFFNSLEVQDTRTYAEKIASLESELLEARKEIADLKKNN